MNMIYEAGGNAHAAFLFPLHAIACLTIVTGVVFLLVWAVKTLTTAQLKVWGISLLAAGVVLCLLMCVLASRGYRKISGDMDGRMMMMHTQMMGDDMGMMQGMDGDMKMMSNMGMMLEGLEGDAFDDAFIRMMIPHHEGAIDMAEESLKSAKHPEMKQLANDIIKAQQREIDMMKGWLTTWGYEN